MTGGTMFALFAEAYGDAEVMSAGRLPEPHAGPGGVRIRVLAASVNPADVKTRNGAFGRSAGFPLVLGLDAAGVVDEVGEGVEGVSVGDEVLGSGRGTHAEFAVMSRVAPKPADMGWVEAAALPLVTETAERCLRLIGGSAGQTLLIEGASGGVGASAVQLALARGARVIGTASPRNHAYLESLGAEATTYGPGIAGRLADLGVERVDAVVDTAGSGSMEELVGLVDDPARVVSIADFDAPRLGARATGGGADAAWDVLDGLDVLRDEHGYTVRVDSVFPLADGVAAFERVEHGRPQGKVVIDVALS